MPEYTNLKLPGQIGDAQLSDQLRTNICAFLDWALLGIGGFFNVHLTDQAPYGGIPSQLRLGDDFRYPSGQVWDSFKTNWVWESNIEYSSQPINISGIWVNNNFYPNGVSGTYAFNISYPQGRVIFNSPIPTNSTVQVEYSYKLYNVYPDNVEWFKQLVQGTYRLDSPQFNAQGSGIWTTFPESRAQLPAVVVESVPVRDWSGYQLGGGQWIYTNVYFHVMANTPSIRDNLIDIFTYQNEKKFYFFDKNQLRSSGIFPLNQNGYLVNPGSTYPNLIENYLWRYSIIKECSAQKLENDAQSIFRGVASWKIMLAFPEL